MKITHRRKSIRASKDIVLDDLYINSTTAINCEDEADYEEDIKEIGQEFTSENTSINSNKLPAIFRLVKFEPGTVNIDYGGGRADTAAEYLAPYDVINLVYDPYNRTAEHNKEVIKLVREHGGADTATCSNVLNVIKEPGVRRNVLENIKKLVKPSGTVYITVYEGSGRGNEGPTKAGYQLNRKTADYLEEIQEVFPDAERKGKLIIAHPSGNAVESATDIDIDATKDKLYQEINNAVSAYMQDEGFDDPEQWSVVEVTDADDGRVKVEVRAEISYDGMWNLKDILDPIVTQFDPSAYFDMVDSGIMEAYVDVFGIYSAVNCATNTCNIGVNASLDYGDTSFTEDVTISIDEDIVVGGGTWDFVADPPQFLEQCCEAGGLVSDEDARITLMDKSEVLDVVYDIINAQLDGQYDGQYRLTCTIELEFFVDDIGYSNFWHTDEEYGYDTDLSDITVKYAGYDITDISIK